MSLAKKSRTNNGITKETLKKKFPKKYFSISPSGWTVFCIYNIIWCEFVKDTTPLWYVIGNSTPIRGPKNIKELSLFCSVLDISLQIDEK